MVGAGAGSLGAGAGAGVEDVVVGAGVDVVVVVVDVDVEVEPPPPPPSDMHHPPLSDIQWYPDGHEPEDVDVEPPDVDVEPPVPVEVDVEDVLQEQEPQSNQPDPQPPEG